MTTGPGVVVLVEGFRRGVERAGLLPRYERSRADLETERTDVGGDDGEMVGPGRHGNR